MSSQPMSWTFQNPTKIIFGQGFIDQIKNLVAELGAKKPLIITGRYAMRKYGVTDTITQLLTPLESETFEAVEPNPSLETFVKAKQEFITKDCDLVIGLGGGSSIDVAKVVAAIADKDQTPNEVFTPPTQIESRNFPLIAVPTTSGTGSEATKFSIANDPDQGTKKAAGHLLLFPDIALVDPVLCTTMPKDVTAHTGLDAISHALESYWAKKAQPVSDTLALDALFHLIPNIQTAYHEPANLEARTGMAQGSLEAGMALSNTMAAAVHSISYPLTVKFGLSHGLACALTLPLFLKFNAPAIQNKIPRLLQVMGVKTLDKASESLTQLMVDIGQPVRLTNLGIGKDDIPWIVEHGFSPARVANNPREVTKKDVEDILMKIL